MSQTSPPLRILLVDHQAHFRQALREIIDEAEGLQVVAEAADGAETLVRVQRLRPLGLDLVLLDLSLPDFDSLMLTRELASEEPALPVIVLTDNPMATGRAAPQQAGAMGSLSKGLAPAALVRALQAFRQKGALPQRKASHLHPLP